MRNCGFVNTSDRDKRNYAWLMLFCQQGSYHAMFLRLRVAPRARDPSHLDMARPGFLHEYTYSLTSYDDYSHLGLPNDSLHLAVVPNITLLGGCRAVSGSRQMAFAEFCQQHHCVIDVPKATRHVRVPRLRDHTPGCELMGKGTRKIKMFCKLK